MATESIDGRLAQNDGVAGPRRYPKEAVVLVGTRSHATPGQSGGAAQLGAHGLGGDVQQEERGVGPGIRIKHSGLNQGFKQRGGEFSFLNQVMADAQPVARHGRGQGQGASLGRCLGRE